MSNGHCTFFIQLRRFKNVVLCENINTSINYWTINDSRKLQWQNYSKRAPHKKHIRLMYITCAICLRRAIWGYYIDLMRNPFLELLPINQNSTDRLMWQYIQTTLDSISAKQQKILIQNPIKCLQWWTEGLKHSLLCFVIYIYVYVCGIMTVLSNLIYSECFQKVTCISRTIPSATQFSILPFYSWLL